LSNPIDGLTLPSDV